MGSKRIGTKLKPRMGFREVFSTFLEDEISPVRSDAYSPEWKPALREDSLTKAKLYLYWI